MGRVALSGDPEGSPDWAPFTPAHRALRSCRALHRDARRRWVRGRPTTDEMLRLHRSRPRSLLQARPGAHRDEKKTAGHSAAQRTPGAPAALEAQRTALCRGMVGKARALDWQSLRADR